MLNIDFILSAHHLDDHIETLIMRQVEDNDWVSSLGIQESYNNILRPLLAVNKSSIIHYLKTRNLEWIEDESNNNNSYLRNKVRNIKIPNFYKKSPQLINRIIESNKIAKDKFKKIKLDINSDKIKFIKTEYGLKTQSLNIKDYSSIELKFVIQIMIKRYLNKSSKRLNLIGNQFLNI